MSRRRGIIRVLEQNPLAGLASGRDVARTQRHRSGAAAAGRHLNRLGVVKTFRVI